MIFTERRGLDIVKELRGLKGLSKSGGNFGLSETNGIGAKGIWDWQNAEGT